MADSKKIIVNPTDPPALDGKPNVRFRDDFDALVFDKGYPVWWDRMLPCPCKDKANNSPRLTCKNCFGRGWFVSLRSETRAVIQSMNVSTQYKDWSIERIGTSSITTLGDDRLSYMDRLVLYDGDSTYSQITYPFTFDNRLYAFLDYPPNIILDFRIYDNDTNKLVDIDISKVIINDEGILDLTDIADQIHVRAAGEYLYYSETGLSVRYQHYPSFHVIDSLRDVMISPIDGSNKETIRNKFPCHYVGRRSHLVIDNSNYINLPENQNNNSTKKIMTTNSFQ